MLFQVPVLHPRLQAIPLAGKHLGDGQAPGKKPLPEGRGARRSRRPLLPGHQPEWSNGLGLAKDDLPGTFPTNTRFLRAGKLQAALPSPLEVAGWKCPKVRGWGLAVGWRAHSEGDRRTRGGPWNRPGSHRAASALAWGLTAAACAGPVSGATWEARC